MRTFRLTAALLTIFSLQAACSGNGETTADTGEQEEDTGRRPGADSGSDDDSGEPGDADPQDDTNAADDTGSPVDTGTDASQPSDTGTDAGGTDVSTICRPGTRFCEGDSLRECDDAGNPGAVVATCEPGLCAPGGCVDPCAGDGKTYVGCEFWGADLDHMEPGDEKQFAMSVSNTDTELANIRVITGDGTEVTTLVVNPGQLATIPLPRRDVPATSNGQNSYAILSDRPVTAHQFNPLNQSGVASNDASLLIPANALGTEYMVLGWPAIRPGRVTNGRAYFTIIAATDNTTVQVTPSAPIAAGDGVPAIAAGTTTEFTLSRGEVLSLGTDRIAGQDLTGSTIFSDRPVAVFSGHECADVPVGVCCCDHLEEQLLPLSTWGNRIVAPKFEQRGTEADIWRMTAAEDNTTITLNPPVGAVSTFVLNRGEVRELSSAVSFVVEATGPISMGQYMTGSGGNQIPFASYCFLSGAGDPAFTLNVPDNQWLNSYIVLTPEGFEENFLNIVAPAGSSILLDGAPITASPITIGSSDTVLWQQPVTASAHRVSSDTPFGLYAYGIDCSVSYAYPGGMNLAD